MEWSLSCFVGWRFHGYIGPLFFILIFDFPIPFHGSFHVFTKHWRRCSDPYLFLPSFCSMSSPIPCLAIWIIRAFPGYQTRHCRFLQAQIIRTTPTYMLLTFLITTPKTTGKCHVCTSDSVVLSLRSNSHPSGVPSAGSVYLGTASRRWACLKCPAFRCRGDRYLKRSILGAIPV